MRKQIYFFAAVLITILWYSCNKEGRIDHLDMNAPAPTQIGDVIVVAKPGGAILTYKIPKDPNLGYVKAVYEIQPGVFWEAKSSIYTDTLALVGFGDTLSHAVKVYSVGKNEKTSEPVLVNVFPLSPPVKTVFKDLTLFASFGGVKVLFKNPLQANIAIVLMVDTTGLDTWAPVSTFYTKALEGRFSARGFDPTERNFAVFLKDRWNNKSDTLKKLLKPLYEELIPKDKWTTLHLPTDTWMQSGDWSPLEKIFDGKLGWEAYASPNASSIPQWFTLDLGQKVMLSRMKEYQISDDHLYRGSAVKAFEIWGSNAPDADGGWTQWQLFGSFQSFKPSGLPLNQLSADDINYGSFLGEDFDFENVIPAVRYIRFKALETYSSSGQITIAEITFWGQIEP